MTGMIFGFIAKTHLLNEDLIKSALLQLAFSVYKQNYY